MLVGTWVDRSSCVGRTAAGNRAHPATKNPGVADISRLPDALIGANFADMSRLLDKRSGGRPGLEAPPWVADFVPRAVKIGNARRCLQTAQEYLPWPFEAVSE
jgi:hypothetical protein